MLFVLAVASGCSTDAVGVAECRDVEEARCEAAVSCGFPAVDECRRYVRDHCLHGVGLESIAPGEAEPCVADVVRAGQCAAEIGGDTPPSACPDPVPTSGAVASVCELIRRPELATSCAFLRLFPATPVAPVVTGDAGAR